MISSNLLFQDKPICGIYLDALRDYKINFKRIGYSINRKKNMRKYFKTMEFYKLDFQSKARYFKNFWAITSELYVQDMKLQEANSILMVFKYNKLNANASRQLKQVLSVSI